MTRSDADKAERLLGEYTPARRSTLPGAVMKATVTMGCRNVTKAPKELTRR